MKGSMEGLLPMLALFIMSMVMAIQSIPLSESLAQIVGDSTEDIERVVDTRAYTDFYFYNYVPLAAEYSINDASYDLGQEAGGHNWNNNWIEGNAFSELYLTWITETNQNLNDAVTGSEGFCVIPQVEYYVTPYDDIHAKDTILILGSGSVGESDPLSSEETPLQATCRSHSGDTRYLSNDERYSTVTNATNNRYTNLAYESTDVFSAIKEELDSLSGNTYTGTATSCSSSSSAEESAESNVRPDLESAVESAISNGLSSKPERDYVEILTRPDENYYVSNANWDHLSSGSVRRSGETTSSTSGTCGCCGEECGENDPPCRTRYSATATASPDLVNMDWAIRDSEFSIIVGGEYESLEFRVDGSNSYSHNW